MCFDTSQHNKGSNGNMVVKAFRNFCKINPLNAKSNPICHLLALLGAHHILHVSRIGVNTDIKILLRIP